MVSFITCNNILSLSQSGKNLMLSNSLRNTNRKDKVEPTMNKLKISIFESPILQSFLVKSNLTINLPNLVKTLSSIIEKQSNTEGNFRSGTITAIKYKNIIKGKDDLFKTKTGFKNACHLIMCHTLDKRKKKMIHIKITAIGTFQVVGIPAVDVEKVVYKIFLLLEKINKNIDIFKYVSAIDILNKKSEQNSSLQPLSQSDKTENFSVKSTIDTNNRLEIVIIPILNNYMLTLDQKTIQKIFCNSKEQIVQKFKDNNFIIVLIPNDPAISIKHSFNYNDFSNHPVRYITWNKKYGKIIRYIEYDSYTTLLNDVQKKNATDTKYVTLRLYSTGKVLISGFNEILIKQSIDKFFSICDQF
jgi:hypothetical protein